MKKLFTLSCGLCALGAVYAQTATNYYWSPSATGTVRFDDVASWLVDDGDGGFEAATAWPSPAGTIPDTANVSIRRAAGATAAATVNAGISDFSSLSVNEFHSIVNDSSSTGTWHIYFSGIDLSFKDMTQASSANLVMRRLNAATKFNISTDTLNVGSGEMLLGNSHASNDNFLSKFTLNTSAALSGGKLTVSTNEFDASNATITMSGSATMSVANGGTSGTQNMEATAAKISIKELTSGGTGDVNFGRSDFSAGDVSVTALKANASANFKLNVYSDTFKVTNFEQNSATTTLNIASASAATITNLTQTNSTLALSTTGGVKVENYTVNGHTSSSYVYYSGTNTNELAVSKLLQLSSEATGEAGSRAILILGRANSGDVDVHMAVGGISGGNSNSNNRIATSYHSTGTRSNAYITIKGVEGAAAGTSTVFSGRIHDIGSGQAADSVTDSGKINIIMDSADATASQYFTGHTYYRGDTTVKSGNLYLNTTGNSNWGIGKVILEGGGFGAVGSGSDLASLNKIGKIFATDLDWSGGKMLFDINGTNCDTIAFSGDMAMTGGAQEFVMLFNIENFDPSNNEYAIISWAVDSDISGFDENKLKAEFEQSGYVGEFEIIGQTLYLTVGLIPEAAHIALLLGLAALAFTAHRRRR